MRILIIEDDKSLAETLRFQLERNQFETDVCHDGEEGLHFIEQQSHDLILLDRMLPMLDGISVLKIAREKNISTPIIFVTALGALNDKITGLDCGADDYLVKPFDFEELLARIRCILRRPPKWEGNKPLELGDISYDTVQKKLYCKDNSSKFPLRPGREFAGIFPPEPGTDHPKGFPAVQSLGARRRSRGRQLRQLHLLPAPEAQKRRKHPPAKNHPRHRLPIRTAQQALTL